MEQQSYLDQQLSKTRALPYAFTRCFDKSALRYPVSMTIRTTSICNRLCNFCSYSDRNVEHAKDSISQNTFNVLLNNLKEMKVRGITISGGGEPSVLGTSYYKNLPLNPDISIFWHTNGINTYLLSNIMQYNTKIISFSFIAHTAELYSKIANSTKLQFINMISGVTSMLQDPMLKNCYFQAKLIISPEIVNCFDEYYRFYKDLGFTHFKFSLVKDYHNESNRIFTIKEKENLLNKLIYTADLDPNIAVQIIYGNESLDYKPKKCYITDLGMYGTIEPNGNVFPCSQWTHDPNCCIGNINTKSLIELWNSDRHKQVIEYLNNCHSSGLCDFNLCRHYKTNVAIEKMINGEIFPDFRYSPSPFI